MKKHLFMITCLLGLSSAQAFQLEDGTYQCKAAVPEFSPWSTVNFTLRDVTPFEGYFTVNALTVNPTLPEWQRKKCTQSIPLIINKQQELGPYNGYEQFARLTVGHWHFRSFFHMNREEDDGGTPELYLTIAGYDDGAATCWTGVYLSQCEKIQP